MIFSQKRAFDPGLGRLGGFFSELSSFSRYRSKFSCIISLKSSKNPQEKPLKPGIGDREGFLDKVGGLNYNGSRPPRTGKIGRDAPFAHPARSALLAEN